MNKVILSILLVLSLCIRAAAFNGGRIRGVVLDAQSGDPVEYADVVVSDLGDSIVAHGIVGADGVFMIGDIPPREIILTVRMIGYETHVSEKAGVRDGDKIDFGVIRMNRMTSGLEEVTVTGEKNRIVYKIDRQTISGSSSVKASGGTAVDILSDLPSVEIDSEGNMSFRGSTNFLVYVDGRPSPLDGTSALQQIPASSVEDIEIITTPSARYKTDGDVGIINISTKRNRTEGWSGLVSASGSTMGTWGLDATFSHRKGKHEFYFGGTAQEIKAKSDFRQEKTTDVDGIMTKSESDGIRWSDNGTKTLKAGWKFSDGKRHELALDLLGGNTDYWRAGDMTYTERRTGSGLLQDRDAVYDAHDRYNLSKDLFQAALSYTLRVGQRSRIDLSNRFRYDWHSMEYTESNLFEPGGKRYEGTRGYEEEHHWDCDGALTYRLDFREDGKFEIGYQYTTYSEHGDYKIKYWNREKEEFEWQDDLATPFYYRRQVHSVYTMVSGRIGRFSYDAGLRADRVLDRMDIEIADASRDIRRTDIFPSAHLRYESPAAGIFSMGYSYRTNRPGIWNLEPYITYEDYYTKKIGNPDIRPEYTHSMEAGWRKSFGSLSLSANGYYRYRRDISDWVKTACEPGVTLDIIVNAGNRIEKGFDVNAVWKATGWWSSTLNGSLFHFTFLTADEHCTDNDGLFHLINWSNVFNVGKETSIQFDSHFTGPKILTQGEEKGYFHFDLSGRTRVMKGRMTLGLVFHDIFRTASYSMTRTTSGMMSSTYVKPKYPNILLSLTYNFNASTHKASSMGESAMFEGKDF